MRPNHKSKKVMFTTFALLCFISLLCVFLIAADDDDTNTDDDTLDDDSGNDDTADNDTGDDDTVDSADDDTYVESESTTPKPTHTLLLTDGGCGC